MSIVRRFGRTLGLTAERRIELSDIVEEDARVSTRFERGYSMVPSMHPSGGLFATEGYRVSDRHLVTFSTGTVSITVDDPKYFTELSNGEKGRVAYSGPRDSVSGADRLVTRAALRRISRNPVRPSGTCPTLRPGLISAQSVRKTFKRSE